MSPGHTQDIDGRAGGGDVCNGVVGRAIVKDCTCPCTLEVATPEMGIRSITVTFRIVSEGTKERSDGQRVRKYFNGSTP